jgi:hypothetical protein
MPEPATKHIAFVDSGHFQGLHGNNPESKEADPQSIRCQGVRHNHLGKRLALILHRRGCAAFINRVTLSVTGEAPSSHFGPWRLSHDPTICQALPTVFFDTLGLPRLTVGS